MTSIYDFSAEQLGGKPVSLGSFRDQVLLIVNTASECGLTPQYAGLQQLFDTYRDRGLVVIGFPSNQFGAQEPGTSAQIATFCERNYGVTFPMMEKVDVNGDGAHPLWTWLRTEAPGLLGSTPIKWNFTKFLVNRSGAVVKRYAPTDAPESLVADIEAELASTPVTDTATG